MLLHRCPRLPGLVLAIKGQTLQLTPSRSHHRPLKACCWYVAVVRSRLSLVGGRAFHSLHAPPRTDLLSPFSHEWPALHAPSSPTPPRPALLLYTIYPSLHFSSNYLALFLLFLCPQHPAHVPLPLVSVAIPSSNPSPCSAHPRPSLLYLPSTILPYPHSPSLRPFRLFRPTRLSSPSASPGAACTSSTPTSRSPKASSSS